MEKNERLKVAYKHLKDSGLAHTQKDIAIKMGASEQNISSAFKGVDRVLTDSFIRRFNAAYDDRFNEVWLLTGEGDMLLPEVNKLSHPKATEKNEEVGEVTLYDVEAAANLKTLLADKTQNILGKIQIPNIPKCDGAVYVRGDSMYPLLKTGDIVAYKEIPLDIQHIIWGEMYLISIDLDGDEYLSVKYLKHSDKGEDWIKLVSYNPHHEPKDFPLSSVRALALVKLSIRMNTIK